MVSKYYKIIKNICEHIWTGVILSLISVTICRHDAFICKIYCLRSYRVTTAMNDPQCLGTQKHVFAKLGV